MSGHEGRPETYLQVYWLISNWCNYTCAFCVQDHRRQAGHAFDYRRPEEWASRLTKLGKRLGLIITGGEPFLDRDNLHRFMEAILACPDLDHLWIDTNASVDPSPFKGLPLAGRVHVNASYHPEMVRLTRFIDNLERLRQAGFRVDMVNFVMNPSKRNLYPHFRDIFRHHGYNLNPGVFRQTGHTYSEEEINLYRQYLSEFDWRMKIGVDSPAGKTCEAFTSALRMDWQGTLTHCSGRLPVANLFNEPVKLPLMENPGICRQPECASIAEYSFLTHSPRQKRNIRLEYLEDGFRRETPPPYAPRILLFGYYGFANLGDEVILQCIVRQLRRRFPSARITVASETPEATARNHGIEAVHRLDWRRLALEAELCDLIISGGGGLFQDTDITLAGEERITVDLFTGSQWGIPFYGVPFLLKSIYDKPLMVYAQGIGPLRSTTARNLTAFYMRQADLISVRDEASRAELIDLGISPDAVAVSADPAYALERPPLTTITERYARLPIPSEPFIAVIVRPWPDWLPGPLSRTIAGALDAHLTRHEGHCVFIPFQPAGWCDDRQAAEAVRGEMSHQDRAVILECPPDGALVAEVLARARAILTLRLHGLILAAVAGKPAVSLSYDPKVREQADRLGLGDFCLDLPAASPERIGELLETAMERGADLKAEIQARVGEMKLAASRDADRAAGLIMARWQEDNRALPEPVGIFVDVRLVEEMDEGNLKEIIASYIQAFKPWNSVVLRLMAPRSPELSAFCSMLEEHITALGYHPEHIPDIVIEDATEENLRDLLARAPIVITAGGETKQVQEGNQVVLSRPTPHMLRRAVRLYSARLRSA